MHFIPQTKLPNLIGKPDQIKSFKSVEVPILPAEGGHPRNCVLNVKKHISDNGGSAKFGWYFSTLGNVAIKFIGHCVVKGNNEQLLCVTPPESPYVTKLGFMFLKA